jgi:HSP20 family protein
MPWDPVRDLLTMQGRLESLFGQATPGWVPPVDLVEAGDRYVLTLEVPGLDRSDVVLEFADQVLTVRGARPVDTCGPERYQQLERGQGPFSRAFRFGSPVLSTEIVAEINDGVLTVSVPKTQTTSGSRRIEVS